MLSTGWLFHTVKGREAEGGLTNGALASFDYRHKAVGVTLSAGSR